MGTRLIPAAHFLYRNLLHQQQEIWKDEGKQKESPDAVHKSRHWQTRQDLLVLSR